MEPHEVSGHDRIAITRIAPHGAISIAVGLTIVAFIENLAPWGPFYVIYAVLTIIAGLRLRTIWRRDAPGPRTRVRTWWAAIGLGVGFQIVGAVLMGVVVPALLAARGVPESDAAGPRWSLDAALRSLAAGRAESWGVDAHRVMLAYLAFVTAWAGFGEEVFYRGTLHGALQPRWGFVPAATISSAFFAVRHATQLAGLGAEYPWGAAAVWMVFAFLFGFAASALFARTRRLGPAIVAHYVLNLIPFVAFLASPRPG